MEEKKFWELASGLVDAAKKKINRELSNWHTVTWDELIDDDTIGTLQYYAFEISRIEDVETNKLDKLNSINSLIKWDDLIDDDELLEWDVETFGDFLDTKRKMIFDAVDEEFSKK